MHIDLICDNFASLFIFMVFKLDNRIAFPDPHFGEPDGLIAIGGDLSAERLLLAYCNGIFPWYSFKNETIMWFCPMERFVIFPEKVRISHSMRNVLNKNIFTCTINKDFTAVIQNCSTADGRCELEGAWLGPDMISAYQHLHDIGFATSVEVWHDGQLVGGLYGVTIGHCFFGESMFSLEPNASKAALIFLAQTMAAHGGQLIDCQFETEHLKSIGGEKISYDEYLRIIRLKQ